MAASAPAQSRFYSAPGRVSTWVRQGVESLVAAQKILLDLTAQENALAIGMIRERMKMPLFHPGEALVGMTNQGVAGFTGGGKILLDLAAAETNLVVNGLKDVLRLGPAAGTVADILRHRADTFIDMHRRLLDGIAEQMDAMASSYKAGKGLNGGDSAGELARRALDAFVQTEKKFLNMVSEEVTAATEGTRERKSGRDRSKILTQLAHDAVDKYIDAQKQLLALAIKQFEAERKAAGAAMPASEEEEEARTSLAELTQKSVKNFVAAEKSLLDLAVRPAKSAQTTAAAEAPARRKGRRRAGAAKRASA